MTTPKKIWWHDYRKRMNRPNIRNMSTEIILRKNFRSTIKEYVSECSVGGIRFIFSSDICLWKRLICMVVLVILLSSIFYFLRYIWIDNLAKPFIVTLETTAYPIRNIDFPAVAVCNFNRISKKALDNFVMQSYASLVAQNESVEEVKWFTRQLGRLVDHTHYPPLMLNPLLMSFAKYLGDTHNMTKLMRQLAPSCDEMLLRCTWSGKAVDCKSIFKVRRTVHGHCCAFNYVLAYDSAGKPDKTIQPLKRQTSPGIVYGLNVILNPMVKDYAYPMYNLRGVEVLLYDPTHFADPTGGRVIQRISQPGQGVFFKIKSTKQIATPEVRKYSKLSRKCLFHDEIKDKFSNLYSYSACIVNCRIKTMQALCKCTPYYLPVAPEDGPVCTLDNLKCLNKYKEKFYHLYPIDTIDTSGLESEIQNSLFCPDCMPDCELTQHFMRHSKIPLDTIKYKNKHFASTFLAGLNKSNVCLFSVYQATTDGVLNRLDVVSYWFEILSNVGGYCGILVGLSIISIIELPYFFVFRFVANVVNSTTRRLIK